MVEQDIATAYQAAITNHIQLARPMKIVIDAGNGQQVRMQAIYTVLWAVSNRIVLRCRW